MNRLEKALAYDKAIAELKKYEGSPTLWSYSDMCEKFFPELAESEDERIRKEILAFINRKKSLGSVNSEELGKSNSWIAWLEKQGEQPKKHDICDYCDQQGSCVSPCPMKLVEKQGEQKPADKVEPKFHEGDWIVSPNGVYWHIDKISNSRYEVTSNTGESSNWPLDTKIYHKFNIQDAKDGDVLATHDYILIFKEFLKNDGGISYCHYDFGAGNPQFIWFEDKNWYFGKEAIIYPATKEQRDTLMRAMADAGYTFDFDKKELKKIEQKSINEKAVFEVGETITDGTSTFTIVDIVDGHYIADDGDKVCFYVAHKYYTLIKEQKPAWSEEDEKMYNAILRDVRNGEPLDKLQYDWLKSLKERVQPQLKQEWSEEDRAMLDCVTSILCQDDKYEENERQVEWLKGIKDKAFPQLRQEWSSEDNEHIRSIISTIEYCRREDENAPACVEVYNADLDWLKSLRPQSTWKPSKEMLEALYKAIPENVMEMSEDEMLLDKLYQGLKYGKVLSEK